jgi:hypothetical protein
MDAEIRDLERSGAVTRAARCLELEPFLQPVIAADSELPGSEGAAILEFDERGKSLRFLAVPRADPDARHRPPIPIDESFEGPAIKRSEPLPIPDHKTDTSLRTSAGVTLMRDMPGVLEAVNKNQPDYTEEDVTILETLASMAALAIDRSSLKHHMDACLADHLSWIGLPIRPIET